MLTLVTLYFTIARVIIPISKASGLETLCQIWRNLIPFKVLIIMKNFTIGSPIYYYIIDIANSLIGIVFFRKRMTKKAKNSRFGLLF